MRNVLLTFALLLCFGLSYGQIKVITNGDVGIGTSTPVTALTVEGNGVSLSNPGSNKNIIGGVDNSQRLAMSSSVAGSSASSSFFTMWGDESHGAGGANPARGGELAIGCAYFQVSPGKPVGGFGSLAFEVNASGDTQAYGSMTATSYITASDKKLKSNVRGLERGLNEILQLETKEYNYTSPIFSEAVQAETQFGLLAQDLQAIVPEAVTTKKYSDHENGVYDEFLAIDMNKITFMLVNSIQEQQEMIETQAEKIAELQATIIDLANGTTIQNVEVKNSRLGQNAPNPFNESTVINYSVPTKANTAVLQVFDLNGQLLKTVNVAKGNGQLTINAGELAAGTYSYNLVVDGAIVDTKKMVLTK